MTPGINVALQWFRGINSVLGVQRTGVYGGIDVCQWAAADGVIGNSRTPGHRWAWQTGLVAVRSTPPPCSTNAS